MIATSTIALLAAPECEGLSGGTGWAQNEFGGAPLGDKLYFRRAWSKMRRQLLAGLSNGQKINASRLGADNFARSTAIPYADDRRRPRSRRSTPANILAPAPLERSIRRMRGQRTDPRRSRTEHGPELRAPVPSCDRRLQRASERTRAKATSLVELRHMTSATLARDRCNGSWSRPGRARDGFRSGEGAFERGGEALARRSGGSKPSTASLSAAPRGRRQDPGGSACVIEKRTMLRWSVLYVAAPPSSRKISYELAGAAPSMTGCSRKRVQPWKTVRDDGWRRARRTWSTSRSKG